MPDFQISRSASAAVGEEAVSVRALVKSLSGGVIEEQLEALKHIESVVIVSVPVQLVHVFPSEGGVSVCALTQSLPEVSIKSRL